ncbi:UNVERIFIED_CONTAM: hypothetical protein GTU68_063759 [Idotea baltica]|nr:hypothetical protein [Idotea baltica]
MEFKDIADFKTMIGKDLPPSVWMTITQEMIDSFAKATQDFQWIHEDTPRTWKESPFKKPIAHGFMSVSLLSHLLEKTMSIQSSKMGVNYGLNKVRFPHPLPVGSRVRLCATVASVEDYEPNGMKATWNCVVEIEGVEKPACVAEWVGLMFE